MKSMNNLFIYLFFKMQKDNLKNKNEAYISQSVWSTMTINWTFLRKNTIEL